jgi:hypothetical protein
MHYSNILNSVSIKESQVHGSQNSNRCDSNHSELRSSKHVEAQWRSTRILNRMSTSLLNYIAAKTVPWLRRL